MNTISIMERIANKRNVISRWLKIEASTPNWPAARRNNAGKKDSTIKAAVDWRIAKEARQLRRLFSSSDLNRGYIRTAAGLEMICFNGFTIWTENLKTGRQTELASLPK